MNNHNDWWDTLLEEAFERRDVEAMACYRKAMQIQKKLGKRFDKDEFKRMIDLLMKADALGCPMAGYRLGTLCQTRNPERAFSYFKSVKKKIIALVEKGDAEAILCAAEMYHYGNGVSVNQSRANELLDFASQMGSVTARTLRTSWQDEKYFPVWMAIAKVMESDRAGRSKR